MTREESDVLCKVAIGAWSREYTPELGTSFWLALEHYDYAEAIEAIGILLKQPDRKYPPNPGEIVGQLQARGRNANPARRYFKPENEPANALSPAERAEQIQHLKNKYPSLFNEN